jgi:ankyrin repeat protein
MTIGNDFIIACKNGNLPAVREYLERGFNIDIRDGEPLQWAVFKGHFKVVEYLIKNRADIHAENDYAFRLAVKYKCLQIANILRKAAGNKYKCHRCLIRSTCLELCEDFRQH